MENIKEILYNLAMSENKMADEASDVYQLLKEADKREVADYIEKLNTEYFELLKLGHTMQNPDLGKRQDYYGEDLHDIDYFMEKLGVQKENGQYTNDMRAAFANPKNAAYFGNADRDMLSTLAKNLGYANTDMLRNDIKRTADAWSRQRAERGYDEDNSVTWRWFTDLGQEIILPRVREARLAGREATIEDYVGDAAELGLNFVPGFGLVSKGGKLVARMPKGLRIPSYIASEAIESTAAPVGSQAIDIALYGDDDPRGKWDWGRVGLQYGGAIGAKGAIKMGARTAKDAAETAAGKDVGGSAIKSILDAVEEIGDDASANIARREGALKARMETVRNPRYTTDEFFLTPEQNRTGVFGSTEDFINEQDFLIRKAEAERLAKSQKARKEYAKAQEEYDNAVAADEDIRFAETELEQKREAARLKRDEAKTKMKDAKAQFLQANKAEDDIVMLDDGRLVYNDNGVIGGESHVGLGLDNPNVKTYGAANWNVDMNGELNPLYMKKAPENVTVLRKYDKPIRPNQKIKIGDNPNDTYVQTVKDAPRDTEVRKLLSKDKDFDAVVSGRAARQHAVNTGANVAFNAAAREGAVGQGLGMDEKRQAALWNKTMMQLRPLVQNKDLSIEGKRAMTDAIMNVMTYGLDNLPEEMYRKNPVAYRAIAKQLGSSDWSHWSEHKVPDYPTTSFSSSN